MPKFPAKHTLTSDRLILTVSMVSAILLLYSHGMFIFPFSLSKKVEICFVSQCSQLYALTVKPVLQLSVAV